MEKIPLLAYTCGRSGGKEKSKKENTMKKLLGIALVLALMVTMCFGSVALAAEPPTTVEITWGGGGFDSHGYPVNSGVGYLGATVTAGRDATITFDTAGTILGQFIATDWNDLGSHIGGGKTVDWVSSQIHATVASPEGHTGVINYRHERNYSENGYKGQYSYNGLLVQGGSGELAMSSVTHWMGQQDQRSVGDTVGYPGEEAWTPSASTVFPGVHQFEAEADYYEIVRRIDGGNISGSNEAEIFAWGSGAAGLTSLYSAMGCTTSPAVYDGSAHLSGVSFDATGTGRFQVGGLGPNSVTFPGVINGSNVYTNIGGSPFTITGTSLSTTAPGANLLIQSDFAGGLSFTDFSLDVK